MFRKKLPREKLTISTAALPDIVFMLLFFFMVTTVMREDTLKVQVALPAAPVLETLNNQALTATIFVGQPIRTEVLGAQERLQVDDHFIKIGQVGAYVLAKREALSPQMRSKFKTVIKADKGTKMKLITAIKEALKTVNVLNIHYACTQDIPKV
ncbi:MAG: biopolymer transporter ExbD [Flavobacteriales bacterium]|nr:biopolymer transporter ExbD [Flavobacteriales bacterium]